MPDKKKKEVNRPIINTKVVPRLNRAMLKMQDVKTTKKKTPSDTFLERYRQSLLRVLYNNDFINLINKVRKSLGIPPDGFDIPKDESKFKQWLIGHKKYNFKIIDEMLTEYPLIRTYPRDYLINLWRDVVKDNKKYDYYCDDIFIMHFDTPEIYANYIEEKPFSGVFDYILFSRIPSPRHNFTYINHGSSVVDPKKDSYITLYISPNTSKNDVLELWPEISKYQKKLSGYSKSGLRYQKNFDECLYVFAYSRDTDELIKRKGLKGKEARQFKSKRLYEIVDKLYYSGEDKKLKLKDEKKILAKIRKDKSKMDKQIKEALGGPT